MFTTSSARTNETRARRTDLFEYVCQQENYAPTLMVGEGTKVDRTSPIVP